MTTSQKPKGLLLSVMVLFFLFPLRPAGADQYLVKFTHTAAESSVDRVVNEHGLGIEEYFEETGIYLLTGEPLGKEGLEALNADPDVLYAEPNYEIQANTLPNDPWFPKLWGLHNTGQNQGIPGSDLGMDDVWDFFTGSTSMVVAVIDSGVDYKHEDLAPNMWKNPGETAGNRIDDDGNGYVDDVYGFNFYKNIGDPMDDYYHGTHVAGTIGAVGDNGTGVTGVSWNVRLMALKFMGSDGRGSLSNAIRAIEYAVKNGAKVINSSWNFTYPGLTGLPTSPSLEPVQSLRDAVLKADQAGVLFVAAAGNSGSNNDVIPNYPASYSVGNILSVAATDAKDLLPAFSNYGLQTVDLAAPGSVIFSTWPTWKESPPYHHLSGTSMSAPHVAGAAALLWAADPKLTHRQVIDRVLQGVRSVPGLVGKSVTGGTLDVYESLSLGNPFVNHPPVATAGPNQLRRQGDTVLLQGRATDQDGDSPLSYRWTLARPLASRTVLANATQATASFYADVPGTYTAQLTAGDGKATSLPSTAKVYVTTPLSTTLKTLETSFDLVPIITAMSRGEGLDPEQGGRIRIGEAVTVDASASGLPLEEEVAYEWTFIERPADSESVLEGTDQVAASFVPDLGGRYTVQLTLQAGKSVSDQEISFMAVAETTQVGSEDSGTPAAGDSKTSAAGPGCSLIR